MSEHSPILGQSKAQEYRGVGKIDLVTLEWRPLTKEEFLRGEDYPATVADLGILTGERPWFMDLWDNVILSLQLRDVRRIRQEANTFWQSHFTPERMANRWQIPSTPERAVQRIK